MKGYKSYKESGIEWIGEIPEHWNKLKIGRSFDLIGSGTTPNTNVHKFYNEGNINWLNTGDLNDGYIFDTTKKITEVALKETSLRIFPEGSIVIALYGATIGKLGHLKIETTTNQACCVLSKSNKITNRFLFYFFLASRKNIISMSYGGGQPNISQELIKQLHLPAPSIEEQTAIASFLDYKTNLIDVTIEKKKRLIALLKEKRQAVINEAVTKGLNPNVPMKDSGVEWLGEVPKHWEVKKLKHVVSCNDETLNDKTDKDFEINYIEIGDVSLEKGVENYTKMKFSEAPSRARRIVKENDIILSTVRTYLKAITKVNSNYDNFIASTGFAVLRSKFINPDFLGAIVKTENFIDEIISLSVGVSYPAINSSILLDISIPLPPEDEQLLISDKIDKEFISFQNLISKIQIAIDNLQTYRQSLILEAVTGKIDVRDWQSSTKNI